MNPKSVILILACFTLVSCSWFSSQEDEVTISSPAWEAPRSIHKHYDKDGRYTGYSIETQYKTKHFDGKGEYQGYTEVEEDK